MKKSQFRKTVRVTFVLGKRFRSSYIACWLKQVRALFSILGLLCSKTGIGYIVEISKSFEKIICGFILRNNISPKNVKGRHFGGLFETPVCCHCKKIKGGPFRDKNNFEENVAECWKNFKKGPYSLARFCILRWKWNEPKGTLCTILDEFPLVNLVV